MWYRIRATFPRSLKKALRRACFIWSFPSQERFLSRPNHRKKRRAIFYSASALVVERFSLSLASTGLNCPSLNSSTSSTRTRASGFTRILFSFGVGYSPTPWIALGPAFKERSEHLRRWDHETKPVHILFSCRVLGEIPIFSRSIGRYLPIDRSHLRKSLRAQLALFVDVTRAGRGMNCPIRCWSCGASLPYQWSLRLESESVKLLSAPLDSCVLGLATQSIASVKWLMFDWAFALQGLRNRLNHPCTSTR